MMIYDYEIVKKKHYKIQGKIENMSAQCRHTVWPSVKSRTALTLNLTLDLLSGKLAPVTPVVGERSRHF